jgi:phosphinothricin acetyltransferase
MIRLVHADDAPSLCSIYNPYILGTTITFEEQPVAPEEMRRRILDVSAQLPWLVYLAGSRIVGYAYASKWRARAAYRHSVESTVYVDSSHHRQGIGRAL